MNVTEAVDTRMSCRAFLRTPVPESTVRAILEAARRSPSGGNLQPWHIDVVGGAKLDELKAIMAAKVQERPRSNYRWSDNLNSTIRARLVAARLSFSTTILIPFWIGLSVASAPTGLWKKCLDNGSFGITWMRFLRWPLRNW